MNYDSPSRKRDEKGREMIISQPTFNGRRVRAWCVDAGMTHEELAKRLGIANGTLKSWIYGQRNISFNYACAIADVFGKSVDELRERASQG